MTGSRIHRFDFGALRDFRGPMAMRALKDMDEEDLIVVPPAPSFGEADIEAARMAGKKQGYAEGFAAGQADALKQVDHQVVEANEVIRTLGEMIGSARARYEQLLAEESTQLSPLVTAIAQKVAGEALNARGVECIVALVAQCLPVIFNKPKLVIEMHPNVFEHTLNRIEATLREGGVEAEIQFRANEALAVSDVRLDWGSGQMARDTQALWNEIREILARTPLEIPPPPEPLSHPEPQE